MTTDFLTRYCTRSGVLREWNRLSHENPDVAAVDVRLLTALTLGITEDDFHYLLGPASSGRWVSMREAHDREVQFRRLTNRVGMPR